MTILVDILVLDVVLERSELGGKLEQTFARSRERRGQILHDDDPERVGRRTESLLCLTYNEVLL
jgi:hypothetical protein